MPISSLLLEVETGREAEVAYQLSEMKGVDVFGQGGGQVVATTDTATIAEDRSLCESLRDVPHVVTANVVFTNMEDAIA